MKPTRARVLVVDDDEDLRKALCEALDDEGYETAEAVDGAHALESLRRSPSDVVLLDLMMPNLNGWEFRAAQLRDPALARVPVVVMTAATRVARKDELGAVAYLSKPVSLGALFDTLRDLPPAA